MTRMTDQIGNCIDVPDYPQRIISLVPSQTELLYSLGLDLEVIAITKFCKHPPHWYREKEKIGGTKKLNLEKIESLQPDLIIANKEENDKEAIEHLQRQFRVWVSDIKTLEDALHMIASVGVITNREKEAQQLCAEIHEAFLMLKNSGNGDWEDIPAAYLIWKNPYMAAGGDNFIDDMMPYCGLVNVFADRMRYPLIEISHIKESGCRLVLLSSEPYPFRQQHVKALQQALPGITIMLTDGEMFSWYGSRLLLAAKYFNKIITQIKSEGI